MTVALSRIRSDNTRVQHSFRSLSPISQPHVLISSTLPSPLHTTHHVQEVSIKGNCIVAVICCPRHRQSNLFCVVLAALPGLSRGPPSRGRLPQSFPRCDLPCSRSRAIPSEVLPPVMLRLRQQEWARSIRSLVPLLTVRVLAPFFPDEEISFCARHCDANKEDSPPIAIKGYNM